MTVAVLPLHHGSIIYPTRVPNAESKWPPDVVLKNSYDGELIRARIDAGWYRIGRRDEYDAEYHETGEQYGHFPTAVANIVDQQSFGYRQDGEPATMLSVADDPETIEVEPLDTGGILVQTWNQLPFGIYLSSGEAYRVRFSESTDQLSQPEPGIGRDSTSVVVEYRQDNVAEWEQKGYAVPTELPNLLPSVLGENSPVHVITDPSRERMAEAVEAHFDESEIYHVAQSETGEAVSERAAINNRTAFPPTHPVPAPLFE
ncbi:hypothetical protein [Halorubrum sp. Atlit-26R]|uniref:hypothetical protein n=1 Tax=Halorubrum sp. Atlit-26R TaxID=2282128 RepID=UPI000EF293D7|nr:hypothetical protein [Halorubrum sp. Atlit-26R]RLM68542.1 hypothetical protein DVK07_10495 [Halorubrum sp. Atlit-26R]